MVKLQGESAVSPFYAIDAEREHVLLCRTEIGLAIQLIQVILDSHLDCPVESRKVKIGGLGA